MGLGERETHSMKKFILYAIRWQCSTPVLALCLWWLEPVGVMWATIIANFIGSIIFFFVDAWIFKDKGEKNVKNS